MLAWVGLGADGLSSSAYGPEAAFRELVDGRPRLHVARGRSSRSGPRSPSSSSRTRTRASSSTSRPAAAGTSSPPSCSGPRFGVVSGGALLVDYVLTITTSIASGRRRHLQHDPASVVRHRRPCGSRPTTSARGCDPVQRTKVAIEIVVDRASSPSSTSAASRSRSQAILPIFVAFVVTHVVLLVVAIVGHLGDVGAVAHADEREPARHTVASLGVVRRARCSSCAPTRSAAARTPGSRPSRTASRSCASPRCARPSARWC